MRILNTQWIARSLVLTMCFGAVAHSAWPQTNSLQQQTPSVLGSTAIAAQPTSTMEKLPDFKDSDIKFDLQRLMNILRDHRHEGWVLHAYPDPTTHRPLIGAGFSLDLPVRDHMQPDPLNPHPFYECSSAELWQDAGLDPPALQRILKQFRDAPVVRITRRSRRRGRTIPPQITDEDAERLLRIAVIQAIVNAKAYSRNFDSLTASQQMALTQLVYQMGVNLEGFSQFLTSINDDSSSALLILGPALLDTVRWEWARDALIQSQWARLYRDRAVSVIAMLDPHFVDDPDAAEARVRAFLPPIIVPVSRTSKAQLRDVSFRRNAGGKSAGQSGRKHPVRNKKTT